MADTLDQVALLLNQMTGAEPPSGSVVEPSSEMLSEDLEPGEVQVQPEEEEVVEEMDHEEKERRLWSLVNIFEEQDQPERDYWLRRIKKNFLFWDGKQRLYWSYMAGDWRQIPGNGQFDGTDLSAFDRYDNDNDRVVNLYKAHGETIISAASGSVPAVNFFPEDADDPSDIEAANTQTKISDKIQLDNDAETLCVQGFSILWKQGVIFAYNYYDENASYGVNRKPVFGTREQILEQEICVGCGSSLENMDEQEDGSVVGGMGLTPSTDLLAGCPTCGGYETETEYVKEMVPFLERFEDTPKGREVIEFYGTKNVKIAPYVNNISESPYLILEMDQHWTLMAKMFPKIAKEMGTTSQDTYERYIRHNDVNNNLVTVRQCWFRPFALNALGLDNEELIKELENKYPDGVYAIFVNDKLAYCCNESMDQHWKCTLSPVDEQIQANPMGESEIPVQEMTNDMVDLTMESILHNIPETFIDQNAIDLETYNDIEAQPGMMFPVQRQGNLGIENLFYTKPAASLSQEHDRFTDRLDSWAQLVVHSFPGLYGGPNTEGGKTASEYAQSRNQALQTLSIYWKMFKKFWNGTIDNAVKDYIEYLSDDEKFTKKVGESNYATIWIRRAELNGKVGQAQPEANEQFPLNWAQKRGLFFDLVNVAPSVPLIAQAMNDPENIPEIQRTLAWTNLKMPGRQDHEKQLFEIQGLIQSQPIETGMIDPMTGQPIQQPSIPIEPEVDNNDIHINTCRQYLTSTEGQFLKASNPAAYLNVMLHLREHLSLQQQQLMQQQLQANPNPNQGAQ